VYKVFNFVVFGMFFIVVVFGNVYGVYFFGNVKLTPFIFEKG